MNTKHSIMIKEYDKNGEYVSTWKTDYLSAKEIVDQIESCATLIHNSSCDHYELNWNIGKAHIEVVVD